MNYNKTKTWQCVRACVRACMYVCDNEGTVLSFQRRIIRVWVKF